MSGLQNSPSPQVQQMRQQLGLGANPGLSSTLPPGGFRQPRTPEEIIAQAQAARGAMTSGAGTGVPTPGFTPIAPYVAPSKYKSLAAALGISGDPRTAAAGSTPPSRATNPVFGLGSNI